MTIAASGAVSLSDLRTEFVGGSGAISYSDLYRGGSNIRAKAANNTGVNLAASVPTSGTINFTNFRSQAKGFRFTYTTTSTDQDADTLFGSDYAVNYPKEIIINSGVTIGGVSDDALDIPSTLAGTLVVNNNGSIIGKGGAANGGAGGNAINNAASNVTINNSGSLLAGGGGGGLAGNGGTGGNGSYTSSSSAGPLYSCSSYIWGDGYSLPVIWAGTLIANSQNRSSISSGGCTYYKWNHNGGGPPGYCLDDGYYGIGRNCTTTTNTSGGSGGAGGSGGLGQGYNQSNTSGASGSGGSSGGTNAGSGGSGSSGGSGGTYGSSGANGANGNSGANGNAGNGSSGSSGSSGGAAGAAVLGTSVTMNNTGTLAGSVA